MPLAPLIVLQMGLSRLYVHPLKGALHHSQELYHEAQAPADTALSELDQARERFIHELSQLKEDEDPTPCLENFIPAILPALKLGLRLVGRQRA